MLDLVGAETRAFEAGEEDLPGEETGLGRLSSRSMDMSCL